MLDFLRICSRSSKKGTEIYPDFLLTKSKDLMIRGGDFYAIWVDEQNVWSTDEDDVIRLVDKEINTYIQEHTDTLEGIVKPMYMRNASSGSIDLWHKYCQKQSRDNFKPLDEKMIFLNTEVTKKDYASKRLPYPLEVCETPGYDKLLSTLYSEGERRKIEWAIGAVVSGDSKRIQKFLVLYGAPKTGKSTVLDIMQMLFEGYYSVFDAKALGTASNSFALEAFKSNPLVGIQHDGDLSRIEDNTRLNSLVSHETMLVNEKFKSAYPTKFNSFLFMGTNKPVKITDAKSGIIRRLIDVTPTGNRLPKAEYDQAMARIPFELGGIASHCLEVYRSDPNMFDSYIPTAMFGATNDFYNFVADSAPIFEKDGYTTLGIAWTMYKQYCEDAKVSYPYSQKAFKEELKNYFDIFEERHTADDGTRIRNYYAELNLDKYIFEESKLITKPKNKKKDTWLNFIEAGDVKSDFDILCSKFPAQYAKQDGTPLDSWDNVSTNLNDISTDRLHYVRPPENHIVIDFDIPGDDGQKNLDRNLEAASQFPPTYAELSKSGAGIHLHYIYSGDVSKLSRVYGDHIEIKVFNGKSSLRRKLTKFVHRDISVINSGLPLKGADKVVDIKTIQSEEKLRALIKRCLNKEIHSSTRCNMDFIAKLLDDAYANGLHYDITNMRSSIFLFAANSTNQSDYCMKLVNKLHFKSDDISDPSISEDSDPLVFYDIEVFPNVLMVNWKYQGEDRPVVRLINPSPDEISELIHKKLVGFNCRRYDNHILYARTLGFTNAQMYELSQRIISGDKDAFFGEAYNISYTDVYDFCSTKQSLKKWEIELGIHHKENAYPWDEPLPEEHWQEVAEYCDNDVIATEAVFNARQADFVARQIQVDIVKKLYGISNVSVNDTTNSLSQKIIFGAERRPHSEFNYRDLSQPVSWTEYEQYREKFGDDYEFHVFDQNGLPTYEIYRPTMILPEGWSILPFFPNYRYSYGRSIWYNDISDVGTPIDKLDPSKYVEIGEGGCVFAIPGIYSNVWDGDITSQHPHSAIAEVLFGPKYTKVFRELVQARVAIKQKDFEKASKMLNGALTPYLTEELAPGLAQALKIVINSIYGLTSAKFENAFRDIRNVDNIVAKRGALFMTMLRKEVEKRGYKVAHIKTDSIKIPEADENIKNFVLAFGKEFGYNFETEADFARFGLVNKSTYIAKYATGKHAGEWMATGEQFQIPYVFKTLFSKEDILFEDLCETKSVKGALYLDMNETCPDVSYYDAVFEARTKRDKLDSNKDKLTKKEEALLSETNNISDEDLAAEIAKGHNYKFVGKVGLFTPVKAGHGGGELLTAVLDADGKFVKYSSANGAKGYRWLEAEDARNAGGIDIVDRSYYNKLVDEAVEELSKYGDFEAFAGEEVINFPPDPDECPF